jgi:hypothetical protein
MNSFFRDNGQTCSPIQHALPHRTPHSAGSQRCGFHHGRLFGFGLALGGGRRPFLAHPKGEIRRLARGMYFRPRMNPWLGEVAPSKEAVVTALARRDHMRVRKIDASAANLLGLSEQVPAQVDYLTDGRSRTVKAGPHIIKFRHVAPRTIAPENTTVGMVIAGLRNLGKSKITPEHLRRLQTTIPAKERRHLLDDLTLAPSWMHPHLQALAGDEAP